jgi:hypothetical protein
MLPRIKKVEFRNVHINDDVYTDNDLFLFSHGIETVEATRRPTLKDFEKILVHEPDAAVFGLGFKGKPQIDSRIFDAAKKHKVELHMLPTPEAAKKFQQLARQGKKVVAKLHITC